MGWETLIFDGTIRENIAYGRAGASTEEIIRAAKLADADAFIQALPDGYDSSSGNAVAGCRAVSVNGSLSRGR